MPNRTPRKAILTRRLVVLGSLVLCGGAGLASLLLWLNRLAEPWAWVLGLAMGATLAPVVEPEPDVDWVAVDGAVLAGERRSQASEVASSDTEPSVSKTATRRSPVTKKTKKPAPKPRALRVAADTILRLSKVAAPPATRFVERKGIRPSGLQLAGVSALGIGVQDGDVLTRVAGVPVTSRAFVVSSVLKLRARKTPVIWGEFWRGQQRWLIAVEMPYLEPKAKVPRASTHQSRATRAQEAPNPPRHKVPL